MVSIQASTSGLNQVDACRLTKGWAKSSEVWADLAEISPGTLKRFWQSKPIRSDSFQKICTVVGISQWQDIANLGTNDDHLFKPLSLAHFITGNPVLQPRFFFGRERSVRRIFSVLNRHPLQNISIVGPRRSGKTSLLHYLSSITNTPKACLREGQRNDWLSNPGQYNWIFIDFQDKRMTNRETLLGYILEQMNISSGESIDLESFINIFSTRIKTPIILLLDEIDVALQPHSSLDDPFWESLRSLATNQSNGNLAFVVATTSHPSELAISNGYTSPFFNIFGRTIRLGAFNKPTAEELITSSPISFPEEDIEWIIHHSHCWPLLLQILCSERLFALEEQADGNGDSYDWKEQGLFELNKFKHLLQEVYD
ncbi:MAG: ATP-binding protein [Cyanobacteria bacterium P01_A01_bin.116]